MKLFVFYIFLVLYAAATLCGCRSIQYVPVETIQHDSIYVNRVSVDTIQQRDSIYVEHKGDTLLVEKYKYLYRIKERIDTAYIERVDSIQVPYPVERSLTRWQQIKMDFGGMAIGAFAIVIIALVIMILIRSRNNK